MIVLNLKTYEASLQKALFFTDIASEVVEETGVRIVVAPPLIHLKEAAERFSDIFSQSVDPEVPGAFTGSLPAESLKIAKVKGSLLNHSEKRMPFDKIKTCIERLHQNSLESLVCAESPEEAAKIAAFEPLYMALEPPELIGSGISVSSAKPEIVSSGVKAVKAVNDKIVVLCGAGVSTKEDVQQSLELGAEGVLLASAFVKTPDPKSFLWQLASIF